VIAFWRTEAHETGASDNRGAGNTVDFGKRHHQTPSQRAFGSDFRYTEPQDAYEKCETAQEQVWQDGHAGSSWLAVPAWPAQPGAAHQSPRLRRHQFQRAGNRDQTPSERAFGDAFSRSRRYFRRLDCRMRLSHALLFSRTRSRSCLFRGGIVRGFRLT
jgi:hypothetical protein